MDDQYPTLHEGFSFAEFLAQIYPELQLNRSLQNDLGGGALTPTVLQAQYENYKTVTFFDLNKERITIDQSTQFLEKNAYALNALVLTQAADGLIVGFANPFDQEATQSAQSLANTFIKPVMVKQKDILSFGDVVLINENIKSLLLKHPAVESEIGQRGQTL